MHTRKARAFKSGRRVQFKILAGIDYID